MPRRTALRWLIVAVAACACVGALAQQPQQQQRVEVESAAGGERITVRASADLQADPAAVWAVISDYDHLAEFIPYMRSSQVLQRDGDRLLVQQKGDLSFLFFHQAVEVRLAVVESGQRLIVARAVGGNLREMEGRYALVELPSGAVRLTYSAVLVPDFAVPPVVGKIVLRSVMAKQFDALVVEVRRRAAVAQRPPRQN
jgi:carbon monoxide dehydrogenase subunit G